MATSDDDDDAAWMNGFLSELSAAPDGVFPDWEDAADLNRLHVQAFATQQLGGFETNHSRGSIRLTGDGVRGHRLNLNDAGQILSGFQNLVTTSGASRMGSTTMKGKIPAEIADKTQLELAASPGQGSVVLEFQPVADEAAERYPNDEVRVDGQPTPLVEDSIDTAFRVLAVASNPGVTGDEVEQLFEELGPRVAYAAKILTDIAAQARLDLNIMWERPHEARIRVRVSAAQSAMFATILQGHNLDSPYEEIEGILHTISDRRKIDVETSDPAIAEEGKTAFISVSRGEADFTPFRINELVRIQLQVKLTHKPGAPEQREYTAIYVSRVDGGENSLDKAGGTDDAPAV